ncbi:MAG: anti-sigma F factor [Lachnospiraceae bacterium]
MENNQYMKLQFNSDSSNESFARVAVAAFCARLDMTIEEMSDIKTAVSEAVTNAIVHGYENEAGEVALECYIEDMEKESIIKIVIHDDGVGIDDIDRAMEPLYTSKPEQERSGMGFSFMEAFMDELDVKSEPGLGTTVTMSKKIIK